MIRLRSLALFLPLLLIFFAQGCKEEEKLIPQDKFSDIYIDLLKIQDSIGTVDILVKPALDSLLKKHDVSKQLYDLTVNHYLRNPEEFRAFMNVVKEKVAALKPKAPAKP